MRTTLYIGIFILLLPISYGLVLLRPAPKHKADWPKLCYYITDVELISKPLKIMKYSMERDLCSRVEHDEKV